MQHLFESWQALVADIRATPHLLLLSDYDGTLTPIVGRPEDAALSPGVREKLAALARRETATVGVISGRSMTDLRAMVGIAGIYYAGNHGLEIEGPGLNFVSRPAALARATIGDLAERLETSLASVAGVIIEDKRLSLSVHYRLVDEGRVSSVKETFKRITAPLVYEDKIKVTTGKKVLEARPPIDWDKGNAVETIIWEMKSALRLKKVLTVYLGDDATDEDAFEVIHHPEGLSIFVGGGNPASSAEYYLESVAEAEELLGRLLELR